MGIIINTSIYIVLKKEIKSYEKPLLITEISGNHNGNKKLFLEHIREAALNGADIIKIQTYEPQDITLKVFDERFRIKGT